MTKTLNSKSTQSLVKEGAKLNVQLLHASSKNVDEFTEAFRQHMVDIKAEFTQLKEKKFPTNKRDSQVKNVEKQHAHVVTIADKLEHDLFAQVEEAEETLVENVEDWIND